MAIGDRGIASFAISGYKIKIKGAKLKTRVELDPNFHYSWIGLRRSFSENQVISKKKVFAEIRRLFLAEITNLNVFSGQKQVITEKKKKKKWSSSKSEGFFWPKSQLLTVFPPKNSNFFLPKKYCGGKK